MSDELVTAFPPYYDEVPMSRGTAGWENPPYYLTAYGLAVKHGYTGTEEEWLASLKGDPGPGIVIWGHYDTLEELEEDVTDPEDGEMYDVGSGAGQLVYYWSGDEWLPLNVHGPQGETGPAGQDGAPGVDGADGASAYEQAVEAGYSGTEAQFMQLLADLPGYTEQARLWAVAAAESATEAEAAVDGCVPETRTVNGKALSSDVDLTADDIPYDGTDSGLSAATAQEAIDELGGAADKLAADLAVVESSSTASASHTVGSYLVLGGVLYRVTTAIAAGETITPGTNVAAATVTGIADGIAALLGGVVLGVYEVPANTTRDLSFIKEVKGGALIMSGGVSSKRGMYIYSSTSTGSVGVTAVLAVTQSGLSITGSGDDIVITNGSNSLFICVLAYKGGLPTLTEPT